MVITAPSSYSDGQNNTFTYRWINSIHEYDPPDCPNWLINIFYKSISKNKTTNSKKVLFENKFSFDKKVISMKADYSHIQDIIEELKIIIKTLEYTNLSDEIKNKIGLYFRNISTKTYFLYEKLDNKAKEKWILFTKNKQNSIQNYYQFINWLNKTYINLI